MSHNGFNVNDRITPMSDTVSSEGPKTTSIQQRSSALSLTRRDFSSFYESFDDVMHCRWWDLQSSYIYIYAFSRCFYPKRLTVHSGYTFIVSMCVPWDTIFALLTQCSTTEPQEHWNKVFAIWHWGTLFLKYSTIFLLTLSQIGEPLPIFTSERLCLSKTSLLIANHVTDLMSINSFLDVRATEYLKQISCFFSPLFAPCQLFFRLVVGIKVEMSTLSG